MTKNEKVLEKVRKLLETTEEKGATAEESQSAIAMAQRLLAKHNLELKDLESASTMDNEVVKEGVGQAKRTNWWEKILAKTIAENFRCELYAASMGSGKSTLVFMGETADVEIAKAVYGFALAQLEHHAKQYRRKRRSEYKKANGGTHGFDGTAIRNDFMSGYIKGLNAKFREQLAADEDMALVVQTPNSVVKAYEAMNLRNQRVGGRMAGDRNARDAGYKKGKEFSSPTGSIEG